MLRDPQRGSRDVQPAAVDPLHGRVEALANFADHVLGRYLDVVERQLGGVVHGRRRVL